MTWPAPARAAHRCVSADFIPDWQMTDSCNPVRHTWWSCLEKYMGKRPNLGKHRNKKDRKKTNNHKNTRQSRMDAGRSYSSHAYQKTKRKKITMTHINSAAALFHSPCHEPNVPFPCGPASSRSNWTTAPKLLVGSPGPRTGCSSWHTAPIRNSK